MSIPNDASAKAYLLQAALELWEREHPDELPVKDDLSRWIANNGARIVERAIELQFELLVAFSGRHGDEIKREVSDRVYARLRS